MAIEASVNALAAILEIARISCERRDGPIAL